METSAQHSGGIQILAAGDAETDRVNTLLIAGYARSNGTLDRAREPLPCPARDASDRPVQFFLAERGGVDCAAAGVTEGGDVLDWTVAPGAGADDVARELLDAVEAWARSRGARELSLFVAGDDPVSIRALSDRGLFESTPPVTVMQVVHFPRFIEAILKDREAARFPVRSVRVELEPGLYPDLPDPRFTIRVEGGVFRVETGGEDRAEISITATATDFSQFLLGGLNPFRMARRCRIRPLHRWTGALSLLRALAPRRGWYTPLGERR